MNTEHISNSPATRYSDKELEEFRELIIGKIDAARIELDNLVASMGNQYSNGTEDTSAAYSTLEDGAATLEKETMHQMAGRQKKFIEQLEAALVRIEHKTYGVCRVTGKLIPKERMRAVPHTTMSMEAKLRQY
ncbi:TraR/DksA C4-type zinc finger protein [Mucilaginibacter sp. UR6-1]|uniref:TraR/DksA family transcriptional regulator n=1 Tax=Mucilaginibacter sp. UR6-1 TaxID=1435643 RepID=UPI001E2836FD|nr:TraR/DksA C4-type zinc finger protein [Mucilaginibacter sp. UR6-1]MCC8410789.1 TraR/DksA C4-type zinc finger protein [Mucilaginibacter sp. UR6-1]